MRKVLAVMMGIAMIVVVALSGCSREGSEGGSVDSAGRVSGSIQIKGSDTMVNLGQAWAEKFMEENPEASVAVTGGGSGTGIAALLNGTTEIAQCSRAMKQKEKDQAHASGIEPMEHVVGYDGIAVVVNPSNPISELTVEQLADIYTGRVTNWSELGGNDEDIVVLSREVNSGTHVYFKEHVLNGGNDKGSEEYVATALLMPSSQAIADEVASNVKAIGYYGMGYISPAQKALKVSANGKPGAVPSNETVLSGDYPISRPLFMYTNGAPAGLVKEFMDFVFSAQGQKIVADLDFVPLQ